ncbi:MULTISPECIES: DUF2497 domain-containing protein [Sphingomonas]|uniref:DUF2497 domain-containing protein n=1 Tax=Sphingomonas TaxID=13687 RepID=UPI000DEF38B0|nr:MULTISPECIES: DUF2497 domain-containing protein [Sphingomonas]
MQDQTDPSMEQALAAIKRVMAEDKGQRAASKAAAPPPAESAAGESGVDNDPVLELDQPFIEDIGLPMIDLTAPLVDVPHEEQAGEPLISEVTAETTRARLAELQQAASAPPPSPPSDQNPFERMVREMMRPMLKDWLDEHLPRVIEEQVKREIGRITGQRF